MLASFALQNSQVPVEIMCSDYQEGIIMIGCENSMIILLLSVSDGQQVSLTLVREVMINQGQVQDYCLSDNIVIAKNDSNDLVEMEFPSNV